MIYRLNTTWLFSVVLTLLSVVSSTAKAIAQTTFEFDTFYDTEVTLEPLTPLISKATVIGFNPNAPYGLTNFTSINNYSQFNPATGVFTFVSNPAQFGLTGEIGSDSFFGSGEDRLFGSSNATAAIDLTTNSLNGSGTITITGGSGRFIGATGTFSFTETESLDQDPTAGPLKGKAFLRGSFQIPQRVPEASANIALIGVGAIGAAYEFHRRFYKRRFF
ncbi:hypothetical protein F7734_11080 [Scytonema sp. UIC 10036]|uniref:hypothetical protein n=1 Tax=Scytonema sp. UIC 10036 TaxID=2304196 RepID=UPI0012DA1D30|nr:hypothetical protein [Scytonema sp. UIC 10036]MUG92949.1 hypothetical protein [Scytonema sp. UIC 10036]